MRGNEERITQSQDSRGHKATAPTMRQRAQAQRRGSALPQFPYPGPMLWGCPSGPWGQSIEPQRVILRP